MGTLEIIRNVSLLLCGILSLVLAFLCYFELKNRDKEIIKLKERVKNLNDYNIKMLTLNDELLKEKQDLILTISLIKDEKQDSK